MNKSICKVSHNGDKYWYFNNHIHREDGPAIEYTNGDCEFWLYGLRHRLDGPAVDWADDKQLTNNGFIWINILNVNLKKSSKDLLN